MLYLAYCRACECAYTECSMQHSVHAAGCSHSWFVFVFVAVAVLVLVFVFVRLHCDCVLARICMVDGALCVLKTKPTNQT